MTSRLNQPPQGQKRPASTAIPLLRLPGGVDVAVAPACDPRRPAPQTADSAPTEVGSDADDLLARAFDILAEEVEAWQSRRIASLPPGSVW
jgi:hypothetical protein